MGLLSDWMDKPFYGGSNEPEINKETEEKILQSLKENPLLEEIIRAIVGFRLTMPWIAVSSGYYDERKRRVVFEEDLIKIQKYELKQQARRDQNGRYLGLEDIVIPVGEIPVFTYTLNDYRPLHGYYGRGASVPVGDVARIWASIIRERLMENFKECSFIGEAELGNEKDSELAYFKYEVPELEFKDWF